MLIKYTVRVVIELVRIGYHYESNKLTDMLLMHWQCYQNATEAPRKHAEGSPERHHPGPRQFINLVQRRNR
jgi:hypothetical protein